MTVTQQAHEQRTILHDISWDTYERLLADHENSSAPRFTYDRGTLEIMSPLPLHEQIRWAIASIVETVAERLNLDFDDLGSTTFRRRDLERGFEADACFYIQNEPRIRGKERIDLAIDPPPDLVVEVDLSHGSLSKLPVYATLGVPEARRYRGVTQVQARHADCAMMGVLLAN